MGLYVDIDFDLRNELEISYDMPSRSLMAEMPYHRFSATIRYDPSYPYPDLGPTPRNVTVGFIQNALDVHTLVKFRDQRAIVREFAMGSPVLDTDIARTGSATDQAWVTSLATGGGIHAFTSFLYGPSLAAPTTTPRSGGGIPLARPGGFSSFSSSPSSSWSLGAIQMQDYPYCSYHMNRYGGTSGYPLKKADRRLKFRIWVCLLVDGDLPSIAANYHILAYVNDLDCGHRVRHRGEGYLSGDTGAYRVDPELTDRTPHIEVFRNPPDRSVNRPVVDGIRMNDYPDGLNAAGACPSGIGLPSFGP